MLPGNLSKYKINMLKQNQQRKISLAEKALEAFAVHETECRLCPRECGINRKSEELGFCGVPIQKVMVSHALLHFGEEPVLSGCRDCSGKVFPYDYKAQGSGTIFFSGCNLRCITCQNYQISHEERGILLSPEELGQQMLDLQNQGALNINLVSPSHVLPAVLRGLIHAFSRGLSIPLVYNTHGYEKAEVIHGLQGLVDVYLPDLKYFSRKLAMRLSQAPDYFIRASESIREMYCQHPVLKLNKQQAAVRGLIIRHLVLPGQTEDSIRIINWIQRNFSSHTGLSLMSQYRPCFHAPEDMQRILTQDEYRRVVEKALAPGWQYLFFQPNPFPAGGLLPDFKKAIPFKWKP
jgi:putative pyruvate formate lyase activating enzyme